MLAIMLVSIGYVSMIFCLAELSGISAFAGGSYGYARCSLGPYWGYMCGCWELVAMHVFLVMSVDSISECITLAFETLPEWELIWCGLVYAAMLLFFTLGASHFWISMIFTSLFSVALILAYLIGGMSHKDFYSTSLSATEAPGLVDGSEGFMINLVSATWFFIGIESITASSNHIQNARQVLSSALPISVLLFVVLAFWVVAVAYFQLDVPLGDFTDSLLPLAYGLVSGWGISWRAAYLLCIPPLLSSTLGLMYSVINISCTMAESGLLPELFKRTFGPQKLPLLNIIACSIFQYGVFVAGFIPEENVLDMIYPTAVLAACFAYGGILLSFLTFKKEFSEMERIFKVPYWVGMLGLSAFTVVMVSVMFFNEQRLIGVPTFFGLSVLFSVYYTAVVRHRQFYSQEEKKKFMKTYILNANRKKRRKGKFNRFVRLFTGAIASHWSSAGASSNFKSSNRDRDSLGPRESYVKNNVVAPTPRSESASASASQAVRGAELVQT